MRKMTLSCLALIAVGLLAAGCGGFSYQFQREEVVLGGRTVIPQKTCVLYGAREISTGVSREDCFNPVTGQIEESLPVRDAGLTAVLGATVQAVGVGTAGVAIGHGLRKSGDKNKTENTTTAAGGAGGTGQGGVGGTGQGGTGGTSTATGGKVNAPNISTGGGNSTIGNVTQ